MESFKWLWKWAKRTALALLAVLFLIYLIVLIRCHIPVTVHDADLQFNPPLSDASNSSVAFDKLAEAANKLCWPEGFDAMQIKSDLLGATNWDNELAMEILQTNQPALQVLAEAAKLDDLTVPVMVIGEEMPYLNAWRNLSILLAIQEKHLLHQGESGRALEIMFQHLRLAQKMADSKGPAIVYLVGLGNSAMAEDSIRQTLASTNLTALQLKPYIDELGKMSANSTSAYANAIKAEYLWEKLTIEDLAKGKYYDPELGQTAFRPRWWWPVLNATKTTGKIAATYSSFIQQSTNYLIDIHRPKVKKQGILPLILSGNLAGEVMYVSITSGIDSIFTKKCASKVRLDATRTLMALRAYQLEHGQLPDDLSALAPEFLDRVPTDDFNGQPFHYSPKEKMLYSVGQNLKDDGGDDRGQEEWNSTQRHLDVVFPINF